MLFKCLINACLGLYQQIYTNLSISIFHGIFPLMAIHKQFKSASFNHLTSWERKLKQQKQMCPQITYWSSYFRLIIIKNWARLSMWLNISLWDV